MKSIVFLFVLSLSICSFVKADDRMPLKFVAPRSGSPSNMPLVFIISGDGGWNSFIQSVADCFAARGMPVVGLDSKKYFWKNKSPENTTEEVNGAISRYLKSLDRKSYILVGFSFGACVAPFIASRTPATLRSQMSGLYSISPDERGDFEIHLSDMLSLGTSRGKYDVVSEMKKLKAIHPVCIFGSRESASVRRSFSQAGVQIITLDGDHHYNENYCSLAESIAKNEGLK